MACKNNKTILHMIDTTGPGGAETVFIQLADLIRQRGYRSIVVIRGPGWVQDELERRGLNPVILDAKGSFAIGFLRQLIRLAKQEKVELVQSHLLGSNVYAALLGMAHRCPVVATYHGVVDVDPNERFRRLKKFVMRCGISRYVAVSHSLAREIERRNLLNPAKTRVIYNGVQPEVFVIRNPSWLREKLGIPDDAVLVGSLGNVRPAKAYDLLIQVAAQLKQTEREVHFVVAGHKKPALMATLASQMEGNGTSGRVHFIGFVEDSADFLAQLNIFMLCSRSEGFSIATLEAMLAGLPVLSTRCGGPEEILTHRQTGWLVEAGNVDALAEGLQTLVGDRNLSEKMGTAARQHASHQFGLHTMVDGYVSLYSSLETKIDSSIVRLKHGE